MEKKLKFEDPKAENNYLGNNSVNMAFSDELDVIRHGLLIHYKEGNIPNDFVLFLSEDHERKFIREMHKCAWFLRSFIKDETVSKRLFNAMITEGVLIAVLKRNRSQNPLLGGIFSRVKEEKQEDIFSGIKNKIFGEKQKET